MSNIITLNLPKPSKTLVNLIENYIDGITLNIDNKRWLDEWYQGTINSVLHQFSMSPPDITAQTELEYQNFFHKHKIKSVIGIMVNDNKVSACLPPHIDRARALAINYYLELGGDNVTTAFYNISKPTDVNSAHNVTYQEAGSPQETYVFSKNWYAYNVNRCHSVENVTNKRIFLSLIFDSVTDSYNLSNLIADYPELHK